MKNNDSASLSVSTSKSVAASASALAAKDPSNPSYSSPAPHSPSPLPSQSSSSPSPSSPKATTGNSDVVVRNVTLQDVGKIITLQKKSFPDMLKEGSIWREDDLKSHIAIFPEGQFCVEYDHIVIGSSSSLIVRLQTEYETHTFGQITGKGLFTTHDPHGDTLYAADVSIDPDYRRLGIGTLLYDVRKDLAIKKNLRRIVAGGRLFNYCKYSKEMTPEEYVNKVIKEEISDPVLTFQLQNGFKFIKILPNYIRDARSLNYATFIEWINPYYKS